MRHAPAGIEGSAVRALLAAGIDYAGLFPPASLPMTEAVARYSGYRNSSDQWALGRFVVPALRVAECLTALEQVGPQGHGWPLAITLGPAPFADANPFANGTGGMERVRAQVGCFEGKVPDPNAVRQLARAAGDQRWYGEVDLGGPVSAVLDELSRCGGRAKVRMGGITPEAFPSAAKVAGFLIEAAHRGLPFKATAGLHHPVRGEYRLTYDPAAPFGTMFGYLNLMAATACALAGGPHEQVEAALLETDQATFAADAHSFGWRTLRITSDAAAQIRDQFDGFGSCSFREPLDELRPVLA